jgi:hypothetical protein
MTRTSSLVFSILLLTAACRSGGRNGGEWTVPTPAAEGSGPAMRITGVVKYYDFEGGFYAIRGSDGVTYDPTNLPPDFRKDGLAVEAEAHRRDDAMGIRQVGPIVDLVRIRPAE